MENIPLGATHMNPLASVQHTDPSEDDKLQIYVTIMRGNIMENPREYVPGGTGYGR